jgi:hypothetical protein
MPNCLEYLLGVAERIIDTHADTQTIQKYYALKEHLKPQLSGESLFTLGSVGDSKSTGSLKKSVARESAKVSRREHSRPSTGKSRDSRTRKGIHTAGIGVFDIQAANSTQQ